MSKTLAIVGYGNILKGDDAIGIEAVKRIAERARGFNVEAFQFHQLCIDAVYLLKDFHKVIFLDCSVEIGSGQVVCKKVSLDDTSPITMSHHLRPEQLLVLIRSLYGMAPDAYVLTVGGREFDFGSGLSLEVAQALPIVTEMCLSLLSENLEVSDKINL